MALTADQIFLYAANSNDNTSATDVASQFSLPPGHVLGSFANAWTAVASGKFLVIAVGRPAVTNLKNNPCNHGNLGSPPFSYEDSARTSLPGTNVFMNAAGATGTDSQALACHYVCTALGTCSGSCGSGGTPEAPTDTCDTSVNWNPVNEHGDAFGTTCPSNTCASGGCQSLSEIQSQAVTSGWNPTAIAESILALMNGMGYGIGSMDADMALAAMDDQGCNACPDSCIGTNGPCECSPVKDLVSGQGFGVLQESWNSSLNSLEHVSYVKEQFTTTAAFDVWFPGGITPCTVLRDPGTAIAEFYFAALSFGGSNCNRILQWVGPASKGGACCETTAYYEANPTSSNLSACTWSYNGYTCTP